MFKKFLFLLFFLNSLFVNALEVKNLYSAKVSIDSQSTSDRSRAIKSALAIVLVKLGSEKIASDFMNKAIKNYNQYLTKYHYAEENGQKFLAVSFDEEKVNNLFKMNDIPLWGRLRPQVIVWLVKETNFDRELLSSSADLSKTLSAFSQQRGLPLLMPIMDLTDLQAVTVTDVWGRFSQPIVQASARYQAQSVVVIRLSNSSLLTQSKDDNYGHVNKQCTPDCNGQFALDWSLLNDINNRFQQSFKFSELYYGNDEKVLLEKALSDITDIIYQQYALSTDKRPELELDIANISSLADLMAVTKFLSQLSAVQSVTLVQAKGQRRRFKLSLIGSSSALISSLKLSQQLMQITDPLATDDDSSLIPVFNWHGK